MGISLYSYVIKMRKPQLINTINSQYKAIKGTWTVAPCMGEYGSIEYAAALLLWGYAKAGLNGNYKAYATLQVTLGDVIGCSFFGMPAREWSNKVDTMLNDHANILTHEEFGDVYTYLKAYFVNEIHSLEFNKGNAKREVYQQLYAKFVQIYNSANDFLDMLDYYTEKGLKIKDYIDIDYKTLRQIRITSNTPPTQSQSEQNQTTRTKPPEESNHDNLEKRGVDKDFGTRNQEHGDFYFYVVNMSDTQLINTINGQYKAIKGTWKVAPCMGEFGSIEFAAVLLLWRYAISNFSKNQKAFASLQITLGDMIGCSFFGMPAGEWSDHIDPLIEIHNDILTYDEFGSVYNYLRNNFADEIHSIEFNRGNAKEEVYLRLYKRFIDIYNSTNDFSDMLDFYTTQGLKIKDNMHFIVCS